MKNILLCGLLLFISVCSAQNFAVTPNGVEPVVVNVEGQTAQQLYDNVKLYIAKKFKNPRAVTKADEYGKLIRFEGYKFYKGSLTTEGDYKYTCEIEFKDNKYRISFFNLRRNAIVPKDCFNKDGEVRKMNAYKVYLENFEDSIRSENADIFAFITREPISDSNSNW